MAVGLLAQYVLVAVAVIASVAYVINRQFPAAVRRARIAVAAPLLRVGCAGWRQRLGRCIAPAARAVVPSCGGCSGCEQSKDAP